jgi:hypothetical protein
MANEAIGNWLLIANGNKGNLDIPNIDAEGRLVGAKAFGNNIIGFWDNDAKKITFLRNIKASDHHYDQVFTGYWFSYNPPNAMDTHFLTGFFEAFEGSGATANRTLFGWLARKDIQQYLAR